MSARFRRHRLAGPPRGRVRAGVVVATVAVALAAGCNGDDPSDDLPSPSSPSPTPSPTPTLDPEEQAAMETFEHFLDAVVAVKTGEDPEGEGLDGLVTRSLPEIVEPVRRDLTDGHTYTGDVELGEVRAIESPIDYEPDVPEVWFEVCLDGSGFTRVDVDTGERTGIDPAETSTRHLVTAGLLLGEHDGEPAWQVASVTWPGWIYGDSEEVLESC